MSDLDLDAATIESLHARGRGAAPDSALTREEGRALADKAFDAILKRNTA